MNNDNIRAGLITISKGIVPILLLLGIWKPDDTSAVGGLLVAIELVVTGFFLAIKKQPASVSSTFAPVVVGLLLTLGAMLVMTGHSPASAQEPPASTIEQGTFVIVQDTTPENSKACFGFDVYFEDALIEDLLLCDDDHTGDRFYLVEPGMYTIKQHALAGYDAAAVDCTNVRETVLPNGVRFDLKAGVTVRCTFTNERTPEPTATPSPTATKTSTPAPTSTARVIVIEREVTPVPPAPTVAPPPVVVVPPASAGVIRPPSTGSAGLLE